MSSHAPRLTAHQIYEQVVTDARSELSRPPSALAFSGFAAGLFMGMTGLGVAGAAVEFGGDNATSIAMLFYPLGFMVVVIGRAQLFTENTLYPVVLVLETRQHAALTLRLWVVVFVTNVIGSLAFASLVVFADPLKPAVVSELRHLGITATEPGVWHIFTSAVLGGWLVALMAWLVASAQRTIGQIAVIWLATLPVGFLHLAHCIASSGYILVATLTGDVTTGRYLVWLGTATAGNILGGVGIVALLNYAQVRASHHAEPPIDPPETSG